MGIRCQLQSSLPYHQVPGSINLKQKYNTIDVMKCRWIIILDGSLFFKAKTIWKISSASVFLLLSRLLTPAFNII